MPEFEQSPARPFAAPLRARARRLGGPEGNARLTGMTAAMLLVLLAIEGVTILFLRPLLSVHIFVGMLLIPPVALKLGSTGWRFMRYYAGDRAYRASGPPQLLMRMLAPLVVVATAGLFVTGVALIVLGPPRGAASCSVCTRRASSSGSSSPGSTCSCTSRASRGCSALTAVRASVPTGRRFVAACSQPRSSPA